MKEKLYRKAILGACRRGWTRYDSIVSAVLKVDRVADYKLLEILVDTLTDEGKLIAKDHPKYLDRRKWRKA